MQTYVFRRPLSMHTYSKIIEFLRSPSTPNLTILIPSVCSVCLSSDWSFLALRISGCRLTSTLLCSTHLTYRSHVRSHVLHSTSARTRVFGHYRDVSTLRTSYDRDAHQFPIRQLCFLLSGKETKILRWFVWGFRCTTPNMVCRTRNEDDNTNNFKWNNTSSIPTRFPKPWCLKLLSLVKKMIVTTEL